MNRDQPTQAELTDTLGEATEKKFIWCLVANVSRELHPEGPNGEMKLGMKRFAPGAKLYCFPISWGDGGSRLRVIGQHRGGSRLIETIVTTKWLTNWRAKRLFNPFVVERLKRYWDDTAESCERAERIARSFNEIAAQNARASGVDPSGFGEQVGDLLD